ncbi:MAG: hypothetical protein JRJ86_20185, partial [Deltaproteobacteria bacterium]|nr:hypothetical protein [Deltaproteobacteria bacterium]
MVIRDTGTLDASGPTGGEVSMEGERVGQFGLVNADGTVGDGGTINLYADNVLALSSDSLTTASAGLNGDGGEVIVFSPDTALFRSGAEILARGGTGSGDGGFVEVSGLNHVEVFGWVNAGATNGNAGIFLIDPTDITIDDAAQVEDITDDGDGTFTCNANSNLIKDTTIEGYLNAGTSVTLDTSDDGGGGPFGGSGDITQMADAQIDFTGAGGAATLTLLAERDIILNGGIASAGNTLGVTLTATRHVDINAAITTNGGNFTSTGVDFDNTGGTISTGAGALTVNHTGNVTVGSAIDTTTGAVDIDAGGTLGITAGITTTGAGGTVAIDATGLTTIGVSGDINAGDAVTFGAAKPGAVNTEGDITTTADNIIFDGAGAVTIGALDASFDSAGG